MLSNKYVAKPTTIKSEVISNENGVVTTNNDIAIHIQVSRKLAQSDRDVMEEAFMNHPDYVAIAEKYGLPTKEILDAVGLALGIAMKLRKKKRIDKVLEAILRITGNFREDQIARVNVAKQQIVAKILEAIVRVTKYKITYRRRNIVKEAQDQFVTMMLKDILSITYER